MKNPLDDANAVLRREGVPITIEVRKRERPELAPYGYLGDATLLHSQGKNTVAVAIPACTESNPRRIRRLLAVLKGPVLVLADRLSPTSTAMLRGANAMFVDQRGNSYFNVGPMYVDIQGRTKDASASTQRSVTARQRITPANIFAPKRAQVSAVLLSYPGTVHVPLRDLADAASVSYGTASHTLHILQEAGYLEESGMGHGFALDRVDAFIDAWADAYPAGLGAHLNMYNGEGDISQLASEPLGYVSGEQAVPELVSGGATADIYVRTDDDLKALIRKGQIRRSVNGNIHIKKAFWSKPLDVVHTESVPSGPFKHWYRAPKLLTYTDLRASTDPRLHEVAANVKSEIRGEIFGAIRH